MTYNTLEKSIGPKHTFEITVGLREGYDTNATQHTREEIIEVVGEWMADRAQNDQPYLTGIVSEIDTVVYAYKDHSGNGISATEPVVSFKGEVSTLYSRYLIDNPQITITLLNEVAELMARKT